MCILLLMGKVFIGFMGKVIIPWAIFVICHGERILYNLSWAKCLLPLMGKEFTKLKEFAEDSFNFNEMFFFAFKEKPN